MTETKHIEIDFKNDFSDQKQSNGSVFDILVIKKVKYETTDIFLANLNIPDLPKDTIKKSIGNYIYYFEIFSNQKYATM